jgi:phosphate/phosphite/phosphonate ABC transporter binding protein
MNVRMSGGARARWLFVRETSAWSFANGSDPQTQAIHKRKRSTCVAVASDNSANKQASPQQELQMNRKSYRIGGAMILAATAAGAIAATLTVVPQSATAQDSCPNGGTLRLGVEPYDTAARLVPIYEKVGKLIGDKLGCQVRIYVATSYNAEIEAMRNGKLEIGEFGPLGYVLAHQVAKAEAVAAFGTADGKPDTYWASIVTYPSSGIKTVAEIRGHSFAFSDPASTSGHLFPAYGLRKGGDQSG